MERKSFYPLALATSVATVLGTIVFLRTARLAFANRLPFLIFYSTSLLCLLTVLVLLFIWKKKASRNTINISLYTAFWQNAVRYIIALDMITFGAQKICHLQFNVPLGMLDDPFSAIPNEMLMWAFMGKYHSMVNIIAVTEIMGGLLLLFNKTRLVGAFVLLPLLLNVMLLDYYYLDLMVQVYITIEVLAVIYLILLEYRRLADFFFIAKSNLPEFNFRNRKLKYLIKTSAVVIPVVILATHHYLPNYTEITGKYLVKSQVNYSKAQSLNACQDSVLTKMFIDLSDFVLEYNNYQRRLIGNYTYNKKSKMITVAWRYPANHPDTLHAIILQGKNPDERLLMGYMGKDSLRIRALKVAPVNN